MRGRGRIRKRGASGGGTVLSKSPQHGQRPSSAMGPVTSARSQWPRASHNGLMHCTVNPGRYCMRSPSEAGAIGVRGQDAQQKLPWPANKIMAGIVALKTCGVKRKGYKALWYGCDDKIAIFQDEGGVRKCSEA